MIVPDVPGWRTALVLVAADVFFVRDHIPVRQQIKERHTVVAEEAPRAEVPRSGAWVNWQCCYFSIMDSSTHLSHSGQSAHSIRINCRSNYLLEPQTL